MRRLPSTLLIVLAALTPPAVGAAQDLDAAETEDTSETADDGAATVEETSPDQSAAPAPADEGHTPGATAPAAQPTQAPKVAVVVVGDPDDRLRGLARAVDSALEPRLRRPFDPGLRGALRGEPGEGDDGLREIRRDRRRLSGAEAHDAPLLAALGRRAGAVAVAVIRPSDDGPELLVLDVRHAAFFEGALPLSGATESRRIFGFVRRRARAAARVQAIVPEAAPAGADVEAQGPDLQPAPAENEDGGEPDFLEQFWPYFVAALLLGGMIAIIAGTTASSQPDQPVLRFVPGG